jgi:hypothetical protein
VEGDDLALVFERRESERELSEHDVGDDEILALSP